MIKKIFCFALFMAIFYTAHAQLVVDIVAGNAPQIPIAIVPFEPDNKALSENAKYLNEVLRKNLESTGLFRMLDPESFPEKLKFGELPSFDDWLLIRTQALIQTKISRAGTGRLRLQFFIWDIDSQEQIEAQSLVATDKSKRRLSHIMGDEVYKRLTGEGGYFDTQIAFIAEEGPQTNRRRRLALMDHDGHNQRYLSGSDVMVGSPYFSPNMHTLIFLSYRNDEPSVWTLDLTTGEQRRLGNFGGMNFAPRFSPCGNKIALSLVNDMSVNLYEYDIKEKSLRQLTFGEIIDTSPSYSPCGKFLAFNSDRSGAQQIHIMNLKDLSEKRISFGTGRYATPAWSPRGDFIAFTRMHRDVFSIGIMTPQGRSERTLASGWFMEAPNWAPNGRRLVFTTTDRDDNRTSRIMSVDIMGRNMYQIPTPGNAVAPSWSPLLP
ncbi:MAG: Tol-Pal system beta propeller repeat protein TolB [Alphaproteobacteria bacterium]|nr:Tol-Pal system beta propeller repeat protein TolB [Alphaproteobacteria bacterium]